MLSVEARLSGLLMRWAEQQRLGRPISPEDLCGDCPELLEDFKLRIEALDAIDSVLAIETGAAASGQPWPSHGAAASARQVVGGYELFGELGHGGMGVVYRALDRSRNRVVALKTVRRGNPSTLYRFKQEFRALADVTHPNLVSLYELVSDGQDWFIAMELVEGVDFLTYVRADLIAPIDSPVSGPAPAVPHDSQKNLPIEEAFDESDLGETVVQDPVPTGSNRTNLGLSVYQTGRLRQALGQLAEGLVGLHEASRLHRDIKPSNILVTERGRVVLLDFGLAVVLEVTGLHESSELNVLGTVAYMSPEQSAGLPVSTASDWYSVGVVLYEALTGRLPFVGRSMDVLVDKQRFEPPAPRELVADLPEDLNALCVALLRRDPEARPKGRDVLRRLSGIPDVSHGTSESQTSPKRDLTLVGRERHLAAMRDAFTAVRAGRAVALYVHGRSGVGKSALLQHFLDGLIERDEAVVLAGRCYEQESVPYKALDSLIDALSRYLKRLPSAEARELLPRDVPSLVRVFPMLKRSEAVAAAPHRSAEAPDPQELRRRAFSALRELLARLGDRRPLVLAIDDLQWGDHDSAAQLLEILRPPDPPVLLLLGCYRSEGAESSPFLRELLGSRADRGLSVDQRELAVEELSRSESESLAVMLLGEDDPASRLHAAAIAREAGGSPFFVAELARQIQAWGEHEGRPMPGEGVTLDRFLMARISRLPEEAIQLLEVIAVSGRPLSKVEACQAAGLEADERDVLAILRSARLIRGSGPAEFDEVETYHDRVRETVVCHLSPENLAHRHRRLAHALESTGRADAEVLAFHFHGAGELETAGEYYAMAAAGSAGALAFDRAAKLYQVALDSLPADHTDRFRLRTKLGEALANAGRGFEAARQFLAAAEIAPVSDALELQRQAALQLMISGHIDEGLEALRTVLRATGIRLPISPRHALWSLLINRVRIRLHGIRCRPRDARQLSPELLTRLDAIKCISDGMALVDPICGAACQALHLLQALQVGEPYRIARALAMEAGYVASAGGRRHRRAAKLLQAAEDLAKEVGHPNVLGMATLMRGVTTYFVGRWREARRILGDAEAIFRDRCTGTTWELDLTQTFSLWSTMYLGDMIDAKRRWPALVQEAQDRGDRFAVVNFGTYMLSFMMLWDDNPQLAQRELRDSLSKWSQQGFHVQHHNALMSQGLIDLYCGSATSAFRHLSGQWPIAYKQSLLIKIQHVRIDMLQMHGRTAVGAALHAVGVEREALLRAAERDARYLAREGLQWGSAHSKYIFAGVCWLRGKTPTAVKLLHDALCSYDAADMGLYAATTRRRWGELLGGHGGRTLVEEANAWMADQGIRNPTRMTATYAPGFPD